jgi:hypothetical protein
MLLFETSLTGGNRGNGEGILGKEVQGGDSPPAPAKLSTNSSRIQIDSKVNSPFALLPSVQRIWDQGVRIGWTSLTGGNRGNGEGILGKEVQGRNSPRAPAKLSTNSSRIQIDSKVNSPFAPLPSVQRIWDQGVRIGWTSLTGGNRGNRDRT